MPHYLYADPELDISIEDMEIYISQADTSVFKSFLALLWVYGPRVSESLDLRARDFWIGEDFETDPPREALFVRFTTLKKKSERREYRVLMAPLDTTPFLEYIFDHVKQFQDPSDHVYPYHRTTPWRWMKKLDRKLCNHGFRHNRLTHFAIARATPYAIQFWSGHEDLRTIMKYIHKSGVQVREFVFQKPIR